MVSPRASATSLPSTLRQPDPSSSSSFASRSSVAPITSQSLFTDVLPDTTDATDEDSHNGNVASTTDAISIELQPVEQQPGQQEQRRTKSSSQQRPFSSPPPEHSTSQSSVSTVFNKSRPSSASSKGSTRSVLPMKVMEVSPLPVILQPTVLQEVKVEAAGNITAKQGALEIVRTAKRPDDPISTEQILKTPSNCPPDEKFSFKILPTGQKTKKQMTRDPVDVLAYPPGVSHEEFVQYLKQRGTLTAHTYPFLDKQTSRSSLFSIGYWYDSWQLFASPMSAIFAIIAGVNLSIVGLSCLACIGMFTCLLLLEFKEREQLYYQLLDHRIMVNFHNVVWLQSRRFWIVLGLSFGFILDCWNGLPIRDLYLLANTFLAYGFGVKAMLELEDKLMTFSRVNEKYQERNSDIPTYLTVDENVFRFYLWKLQRDWVQSNVVAKRPRFSLAPLVWAIQSHKLNLNVALIQNQRWFSAWFSLPKSVDIFYYNKFYACSHRGFFYDFHFNLSPTSAARLVPDVPNELSVVIVAQKEKISACRRKSIRVALIVEWGCLFEFVSSDCTSRPMLVLDLSKTLASSSVLVDNNGQLKIVAADGTTQHSWITTKVQAEEMANALCSQSGKGR